VTSRLLLVVAAVAMFSSARAGTIYVDASNCPGPGDGTGFDPYCSIQSAIDHAVNGDEIIVAPGAYVETINTCTAVPVRP
jgi:pectin methylesterase-like acyl-CoA thioesterase